MPTQDEINALIILTQKATEIDTELKKSLKARESYIKLVEAKYNMTFNEQTGIFTAKTEESKAA